MKTIHDIVKLGPVIPVLAFETVEQGEHVSRALHAGGVKVLEITLRTEAGLEGDRARQPTGRRHRRRRGHHHASRALRPGQEGRRAVRRLAGPHARHAPGVARRGPAAAAGRDDADRHHRRPRTRLRDREVLPGPAGRRHADAAGLPRPVPDAEVLPDRRHQRRRPRRTSSSCRTWCASAARGSRRRRRWPRRTGPKSRAWPRRPANCRAERSRAIRAAGRHARGGRAGALLAWAGLACRVIITPGRTGPACLPPIPCSRLAGEPRPVSIHSPLPLS